MNNYGCACVNRVTLHNTRRIIAAVLLVVATSTVRAADLSHSHVEEFRYSWRIKGAVRFLAGVLFPTTGTGTLKTAFPRTAAGSIDSSLLITSPKGESGGFFAYESKMDSSGQRTLMTYNGYAWGEKARRERTVFDYVKRLARIHKETPGKSEDKVKAIPPAEMRDILTAIYFLRQNARDINAPMQTSIYTDGKEYPVIFRPGERRSFVVENRRVNGLGFEIIDAPGGKKWPGGVKVWLSEDERRIPLRIEIQQSIASVQLDLESIRSATSSFGS